MGKFKEVVFCALIQDSDCCLNLVLNVKPWGNVGNRDFTNRCWWLAFVKHKFKKKREAIA